MNTEGAMATTTAAANRGLGLSRILRPAISVALLIFLFQSVGFSRFGKILAGASIPWLALGLALVVAALVVSAYKWQWLLTVQGVRVPLPKLFSTYLVELFFNNFLPTNIGGDVVRIADIGRYTGKTTEAAASVVGERVLAGFALGLIAIFGLFSSYQLSSGFTGAVVGLVVFFGFVIAIFASPRARRTLACRLSPYTAPHTAQLVVRYGERYGGLVSSRPKLAGILSVREKAEAVAKSMGDCFNSKGVLAWVILLSLAFHSTVILVNYAIFLALGVEVSIVHCFLVMPVIMALQMLPVSVNGLGVREGAYVYFFGWAGIDAASAIAASLLFWALVTVISLAGGLIFALRR